MLQVRGDPNLAKEAIGTECDGDLRAHHLDSNGPVVLQVARQVDDGHSATAKLALDHVARSERRAQTFAAIGHRL